MVTKRLNIEVNQRGAKQAEQEFHKLGNETNRTTELLTKLGTIISVGAVAYGIKSFIQSSINTRKEFEALQTRLENMYGSVEAGARAFQNFNKVAASTPFELKDVVEAGVQLKAFGVDAEENIKVLADLAAFMGTSMPEAASAMGRAYAGGAGAADIFRERGILNLIKMSSGIEDFSKVTLENFRKAMFATFTDPSTGIAGATDKLAKTIVGLESNAADAFTRLQNVIGDKFAPLYKSALEESIKWTNSFINLFTDLEKKAEDAAFTIISSFQKVADISQVNQWIKMMEDLIETLAKTQDIGFLKFTIEQFQFLTEAEKNVVRGATQWHEVTQVLYNAIDRMNEAIAQTPEELKEWFEEQRKLLHSTKENINAYQGWVEIHEKKIQQQKQEEEFLNRYNETLIAHSKIIQRQIIEPQGELNRLYSETAKEAIPELNEQLIELDNYLRSIGISSNLLTGNIQNLGQSMREIPAISRPSDVDLLSTEELEQRVEAHRLGLVAVGESYEDLDDTAKEVHTSLDEYARETTGEYEKWANKFVGTFQSAFDEALFRGNNFFDSLLMGFIQMLERMIAELMARAAIFALFQLAFPGSNVLGGFGEYLLDVFRQGGGSVKAGKSYIVGESGPEVFTPNQSGFITPNKDIGTTINYHIEIHGNMISNRRWVRDELIPELNTAFARGYA